MLLVYELLDNYFLSMYVIWAVSLFAQGLTAHTILAECTIIAKVNGREPKTCLGQIFNCKFGCFNKSVLNWT
jgi:hypothetical protein